jgi:hypothetical protein
MVSAIFNRMWSECSMRTFLESWGNAQCRRLIHLVCSFCVPATAPIRYDLAGDTEILARRPRLSR